MQIHSHRLRHRKARRKQLGWWCRNRFSTVADLLLLGAFIFLVGWGDQIPGAVELAGYVVLCLLAALRCLREYFDFRTAQIEKRNADQQD